jgi:hypothetical protein
LSGFTYKKRRRLKKEVKRVKKRALLALIWILLALSLTAAPALAATPVAPVQGNSEGRGFVSIPGALYGGKATLYWYLPHGELLMTITNTNAKFTWQIQNYYVSGNSLIIKAIPYNFIYISAEPGPCPVTVIVYLAKPYIVAAWGPAVFFIGNLQNNVPT